MTLFTRSNKVQSAIEKLFIQHRLVFWYDEKAELTDLFNSIQLPGVEKVLIDNNEFTLKYQLLIEHPQQKYLLYAKSAKPADGQNWLLDLLLSNYEFHTEPSSLYLQDLELSHEFRPLIQKHEEFFAKETYMNSLKLLLEPDDRESSIRLKMLSILCGSVPEWDKVLYALFEEAFKGKQNKFNEIVKFNLDHFLWEELEKKYRYKPITATVKDFVLKLIQDNFDRSIHSGISTLNKDAYLFVNRWKENTNFRKVYKDWSKRFESDMGIIDAIEHHDTESLVEADTFSILDLKIIHGIKEHILHNTLPNHKIQSWIERRRLKFFFSEYSMIYEALSNAAHLLDEIRNMNLTIQSPSDGFEKYVKQWCKIDRYYRKYIYLSEKAEDQSILKSLTSTIEKAYGNSYLLKLGDTWQAAIDEMNSWSIESVVKQKQFYGKWVAPYIKTDNRVFVIISDALRFESAEELRERIVKEERYTATLNAVLGSLPSYTQLGMAALLPHTALTFEKSSDEVFADGISTQGTPNRTKVLQKTYSGSIAITAEDFLKMKAKSEGREFIKPYKVIYIYSNHIDKTGDDKTSEGKVFEATEAEFENIFRILKHINNMNGYNTIITSDHGYLYQHNRLEDTDFTGFTPAGKIYKSNRRFVLGKNLVAHSSVQSWTGAALGFADDTEAQIPKSINRSRIQGAGSRFVHGGASLQEIVVPVLEVNKARVDDIDQVEIDIISNTTQITGNTFAVSFYQKQPVSDKIHSRQLKVGFYSADERLLSDVHTILFNSTDTDTKAREKRQNFQFTAEATKLHGHDVYLKMEEQYEETNQFRVYKHKFPYRMVISFTNEFDDL